MGCVRNTHRRNREGSYRRIRDWTVPPFLYIYVHTSECSSNTEAQSLVVTLNFDTVVCWTHTTKYFLYLSFFFKWKKSSMFENHRISYDADYVQAKPSNICFCRSCLQKWTKIKFTREIRPQTVVGRRLMKSVWTTWCEIHLVKVSVFRL